MFWHKQLIYFLQCRELEMGREKVGPHLLFSERVDSKFKFPVSKKKKKDSRTNCTIWSSNYMERCSFGLWNWIWKVFSYSTRSGSARTIWVWPNSKGLFGTSFWLLSLNLYKIQIKFLHHIYRLDEKNQKSIKIWTKVLKKYHIRRQIV